jgi:hypothetical protein
VHFKILNRKRYRLNKKEGKMANKVSNVKKFRIIKRVEFILFLLSPLIILSCIPWENAGTLNDEGDKILIIYIEGESVSGDSEISEEGLIRQALDKGGTLTLNVAALRKIDTGFDSKYTATDIKGQFYTRPAILNFIGGQGWHLLQIFGLPGNPQYFFVKAR